MNEGILSSRYAKALLKFTQETGNGDKVYSQAGILVLRMEEFPQFKDYIKNHDEISLEQKMKLLETALGEPMSMEIKRFVELVSVQRRMEYFMRMLYSFISQYREANNIKTGTLITAMPAGNLKERMEELFHERTGAKVRLEMKVNPGIMGGFIFELDDWRLDGSVEGQFRRIRSQLIEKNNRIV